jgi:hypothetical protein
MSGSLSDNTENVYIIILSGEKSRYKLIYNGYNYVKRKL